ncbi:RNA polymerase sigma factor RpoD [Treponema primitia ZAS-2]|uniref:RNA polymerase sigma factor RpoD n=1 Tax=Treponema primitia (strain ATCC BAA-887 / DSM 12427 / ZAS-2) TaxID=545694 RepID=F5YMF9_TREPZ|nr:RNA polymerase sigma factor RpoD/SigA [Treponema primitia]AEF87001.1 RNA polymerase sigma factor RpoD [Treponema primitia ZAS-2]
MEKKQLTSQSENALQTYFDQIKGIPLLSFEEELELSKRIQQGDDAARNRLIEANLRLVVKIARSYMTSDMPFMDIIQEGNLGLMHAAEKYDHKKQVRFSTYACWWIRQSITRSLTNKRRAIRLPHRKELLLKRIQRAYHSLSQTLMHKPTSNDLAIEIGIPVEEIEFILRMTSSLISLDMDAGTDESITVADLQEDFTYSPERAFMKKSSRLETIRFLNRLKDREKSILLDRYQLNGGERPTLKSIGDKMGISTETVRQIELRALKKMQPHAEELKTCMYLEAI